MVQERYLYFRTSATLANDHDETGSTIYPASSFRGACSGDAASGGAVTDDDDRLSLFFTPKAVVPAGAPDATVITVFAPELPGVPVVVTPVVYSPPDLSDAV